MSHPRIRRYPNTMTSPKRKADELLINSINQTFIPKKKIVHHHGRLTMLLYPDITNDMSDAERCFAFNINKTAIANETSLKWASKLSIMGEKHQSSNLVDVEIQQWKSEGYRQLKLPTNITVESYHNHTGAVINGCTQANGQLKPIQDGAPNNCRPNGIMYAKVNGTINLKKNTARYYAKAPDLQSQTMTSIQPSYQSLMTNQNTVRN